MKIKFNESNGLTHGDEQSSDRDVVCSFNNIESDSPSSINIRQTNTPETNVEQEKSCEVEAKTQKSAAKGFSCEIKDWYDLHSGYTLSLQPGYTALVGPNGAGKSTLLLQLKEIVQNRKIASFSYANNRDGGTIATSKYLLRGDIGLIVNGLCRSEGENVAANFADVAGEIGAKVSTAIQNGTPLFIFLDGLDSGVSIDRARELLGFFELVEKDVGICPGGANHEIYILAAVNNYELARRRCIDPRTGKEVSFGSYEEYTDFICDYFKKQYINVSEDINVRRKGSKHGKRTQRRNTPYYR